MADPAATKPFDRLKPFKRINNERFLVKQAPDGRGLARGCRRPEDFGNVEQEFLNFLDNNLPVPLFAALRRAREVARAIANAAEIARVALLAVPFLAALGLGAGVIGDILVVIGGVAVIAGAIASIVGSILDAIERGLRAFFGSVGRRLLLHAIRVIPQWVSVRAGASNASVTADQVIEMEGTVTRSLGNPLEVPFFQWHRWFNWNVQVRPEPEYRLAMSPVADPPNTTGFTGGERPLWKDGSFEIQWDAGALWSAEHREAFEKGFSAGEMPAHDAPLVVDDWCWPQTGMFVWAAGRWVYDCSRVSPDRNPQMCAVINPAKAIATARWKAVRFREQEHGLSVPAIQFMFLASKRGGYLDYDAINDVDYEFILDLPPAPVEERTPFAIAHTRNVPHNTIVVRPRLLRDVRNLALADSTRIEPRIEPIPSDDPKKPPTQVKVTVPLTSLAPGVETCGFVLSLGWFDPNLDQATKVKSCKLVISGFSGRLQVRDSGVRKLREMFPDLEAAMRRAILDAVDDIRLPIPIPGVVVRVRDVPPIRDLAHRMVNAAIDEFFTALGAGLADSEEWLLRVGLNGVWKSRFVNNVTATPQTFSPPIEFDEVLLGEDDFLFLSVSGVEFDPVGDMMRARHADRIITDGGEVPWRLIVEPDPDPARARAKQRDMVFQYVLKVMSDRTGGVLSLGMDNSPLGIIDPDEANRGTSRDSNPLLMKGVGEPTFQVRRTARFARAVGDQAILAEDRTRPDYAIDYILQIRDQVKT